MDDRIARACVRILSSNGEVVGTGFLVSRRMALTCAHVVEDALGYKEPTQFAPLAPVRVDLLGPDGQSGELEADVVGWYPMREVDPDSDVAVLALKKRAPSWARPAPVGSAARVDMKFRTCGYPPVNPRGVNVTGTVAGSAGHGIQLEPNGAKDILRGFSGAAVWEEPDGGVIGMVHSTEASRNVRVAWMASGTHLARLPELTYQAQARRLLHRFRKVSVGSWGTVAIAAVATGVVLTMCTGPTCASVAKKRGLRAADNEVLAIFTGQPIGIISRLKAALDLRGLKRSRVEQVERACRDSTDAGEMVVATGAGAAVWGDNSSASTVKLRFPDQTLELSDVNDPLIAGFSILPSLPSEVTAAAPLDKTDRLRCFSDYLRTRIAIGSDNTDQADVWAKATVACQGDQMPFAAHAELDLLSGYVLLRSGAALPEPEAQKQKLTQGIEALKRALTGRTDERASIYSGMAYTALKRYDEAEAAFKAALGVNKQHSYVATNNLGVMYKLRAQEATDGKERAKFRGSAKAAFDEAERLVGEAGIATANKGLISYLFDGDLEGAVRSLRQALKDSHSALIGNALGYLLRKTGHLEESRAAYTEAIARNPNAGFLQNNLGLVELASANPQPAINRFDRALQLEPTNLVPLMNRAIAYEAQAALGELEKRDEARKDYTTVIQRGTGELVVKAHFNRATLYWAAGDRKNALQDLQSILQGEKPFLPAYPPYVDILREIGSKEEANEFLKQGLAEKHVVSPQTQEDFEVRGLLTERDDSLQREDRLRRALTDYDRALPLPGDVAQIRERRFRVLAQLKECEKAKAEIAEIDKMGVSKQRRDELEKTYPCPGSKR